MKLNTKLIGAVLKELDDKLSGAKESRELIVCGGGALLILNLIERVTYDVDVVTPPLDPLLKKFAEEIEKKFSLESGWLNNGPESLARDLEPGWEKRAEEVFRGKFLVVKSLFRRDLIVSKLFAFCDREENDLEDLISLKPTSEEISSLKSWLLDRDASELWPARVEKQLKKLLSRLNYE